MRKGWKISLVFILALVLVVSMAFAAIAATEYGTIDAANRLIATVVAAQTATDMDNAIKELDTYLGKTPLNPADEGYAEFCAEFNEQVLICAELYLEEITELDTTAEKTDLINALDAFLEAHPLDSSWDGYIDYMNGYKVQVLECAKLHLADVDPDLGTAYNGVIVNKMKLFVETHNIDSSLEGYTEFISAYNIALAAKEKAKIEAREAHEATVNLDEYSMLTHTYSDYDKTTQNMSLGGSAGDGYFSQVEKDPVTGNRYWTVRFNGQSSRYSAYYPKNIRNFVVFEFDITTKTHFPTNGFTLENGGATALEDGSSIYPVYAKINGDGTMSLGGKYNEKIPGVQLVAGSWTNIAIMLDIATYTYDIYVDYQMVAEDCDVMLTTKGKTYTPTCLRYGGANNSGEFSLDNVMYYQGTTFRTIGRLDSMTTEEAFVFYTKYFVDSTKSVSTRKIAYENSKKALSLYWDGEKYLSADSEIRAAVDLYLGFNFEELYSKVLDFNIAEYERLTNLLCAYERSLTTLTQRKDALTTIDTFVANNGQDIPSDRAQYQQIIAKLSAARTAIEDDDNIRLFNAQMLRFGTASTIASMQSHYSSAKEILASINDLSVLDLEQYAQFKAYYDMFTLAAEQIRVKTYTANAKKIVDCVGFISEYEGEDEWVANYETVEKYVLIVRSALASGDYQKDYEGIDDAIAAFAPVDRFFYERLQQSHIDFIQGQLDAYGETDDFIKKMGIVAVVTRYLKDADIDSENETLAELLRLHDAACAEVEVRKDDYIGTLRENSAKFLILMDTLDLANTYAQMKEVFVEAEQYYFVVDGNYEGIPEALERFRMYDTKISLMEQSSMAFIESVDMLLIAEGEDDLFAKLVDCHAYYVNVNYEIDGVAAAVEIYEAAYNEYNAKISAPNEDVVKSVKTSVVARTNCGVDAVVAIIFKKLFG